MNIYQRNKKHNKKHFKNLFCIYLSLALPIVFRINNHPIIIVQIPSNKIAELVILDK